MRSARAFKFAEYLSTYAILQNIALHNTVLIEKRDSSKGFGVYVRDACDAQTTLLVVPAKWCFATSAVQRVGLNVDWIASEHTTLCQNDITTKSHTDTESLPLGPFVIRTDSSEQTEEHVCPESYAALCESLDYGIISHLSECNGESRKWIEWCWRLSLERQRAHSPWWGWLQSLPSIDQMKEYTISAAQSCSVHHAELLPFYEKARKQIEKEMLIAYKYICATNLHTPLQTFQWAVDVLLSRGIVVPTCWEDHLTHCRACAGKLEIRNHCSYSNSITSSKRKEKQISESMLEKSKKKWEQQQKQHDEQQEEKDEQQNRMHNKLTELAVIPFFDLVNGVVQFDDGDNATDENLCSVKSDINHEEEKNREKNIECNVKSGSSAETCNSTLMNNIKEKSLQPNAVIDVASSYSDLPLWYVESVNEEATRSGNDTIRNINRLLDCSYFLCLTLTRPVTASEEVLLPYSIPVITTSVLTPAQNERLTQYVKYKY